MASLPTCWLYFDFSFVPKNKCTKGLEGSILHTLLFSNQYIFNGDKCSRPAPGNRLEHPKHVLPVFQPHHSWSYFSLGSVYSVPLPWDWFFNFFWFVSCWGLSLVTYQLHRNFLITPAWLFKTWIRKSGTPTCIWFLLFAAVIFNDGAVNTGLENTAIMISHGNPGLGTCEPLVTFLSTDQYTIWFYVCFCLNIL